MARYERILMTGGAGFVGSHLAPLLAADYQEARRAILTLPGGGAVDPAWEALEGDLLDVETLERTIREFQPDLVAHLAGQASIGHALRAGEATWRANFCGSLNLASALARHAPQAVTLFSSSASVYGASLKDGPAQEETPLRPLDAYGRSKAAAEAMLGDVLGPQARLIVLRPVNHTGPRQSPQNFVLSSFAAQIAAIEAGRQAPRLKVGDLAKARDFLDVRDVVAAYRALIAHADSLPGRVSCFNVASGAPIAIGALLEGLRALSRRPFEIEVETTLLRPSAVDLPSVALDAGKLREAVGWRPAHSTQDMLGALLDYWRSVEAAKA
ncbi:NAD-dependent epimerase/dehydratase family protein [Methylocystis bryophila]|uniref:Epimerase n=1 Tax=Methylocystis bryophila TaxID=655015 RepID=A0A1W6MYK3_9HYPH|nr:NAD-dependent epimerase/dehydratase family protein [Methylocystis bryophila]ARN82658.1 epimerase [Methylocystis bryophila]BDV38872.1 GDP-6-deoxy-D-lyxo-4-hexulose reductase [Methylocystis bryophila]